MADAILDPIRDALEGQIDFEGQRLADTIATSSLAIVGAASFLTGFMTKEIYLSLYIMLAGATCTLLVVIPPWPWYNRNPIPWRGSKAAVLSARGKKNS